MARPLPPLTWFRSFEASARNLSFTAAADELGLTQSAISQQVRSLEVRLGVALFVRKPRGLMLTDDGRKLLPKVGSSLDQLAIATAEFDTGPTEGLLTVAASVSVVRWIIAPRIAEFIAAHPDLRIRLLGTIWPDEFKAALADVEIRFGSEKQVGRGARRLGPDGLVAVAAAPLVGPLRDQTLIESVGTSEGWRDWAKLSGWRNLPEARLYVDSHGAALDLAASGAGVALTSSLLAADVVARGDLVQVGDATLPSTEGYFLAVTSTAPAAMEFAEWVRAGATPKVA
ncbi:MAG: LysR family transcriptional regulator [Roseicyclus sp.]|nr:LysR family transcriptional regulator [Roseicyclus sp.]